MTNVWSICQSEEHIATLEMGVFRCVEDQGRSYTRKLVSSEDEHLILEELLDKKSKPIVKKNTKYLHYLLSTPFRYPPLKHGSRFGSQHETSLFYASLDEHTALAEKAFYSLFFFRSSSAPLPDFTKALTSFKANLNTTHGLDLTQKPFSKYTNNISSPNTYSVSQKLGTDMRKNKIEAFIFYSSRQSLGKNIGIFSPSIFTKNQKISNTFMHWNCFVNKDRIEFSLKFSKTVRVILFTAEQFFVDGKFPNIPSK